MEEAEIKNIWTAISALQTSDAVTCTQMKYIEKRMEHIEERMDEMKSMYNDHLTEQVDLKFKERELELDRKNRIHTAIIAGATTGAFAVAVALLYIFLR